MACPHSSTIVPFGSVLSRYKQGILQLFLQSEICWFYLVFYQPLHFILQSVTAGFAEMNAYYIGGVSNPHAKCPCRAGVCSVCRVCVLCHAVSSLHEKARQGKVWQRSSDNGHQKTFFLYRAILSFYYFLFLYNIGCHGCQRGKSAAISRLSGFSPDNQTDNRLDNRSDNGLLFLL